jgi:hypothetical protein
MKSSKKVYSSKILKAGAILAETKTLLDNWDDSISAKDNLNRFQQDNILGKASRSRVEDVLQAFRQRYLAEEPVAISLTRLVKAKYPADKLDRILYFHAARSDPLLHDFVVEILWPKYLSGVQHVLVRDAEEWIQEKITNGCTRGPWSENTRVRAARELMSTLRDFGVLQGLNYKRLSPAYLPVEAFSYIAFYLSRLQPSGKRLLEDQEWLLFFLDQQVVERLFMEAHQLHLLEYHAAGSVIRIDFPSDTLEEYAHVILERTH